MTAARTWGIVALAALLAATAAAPQVTTIADRRDLFAFEVELTSDRGGFTQLFFDLGGGINESHSSNQPLRREPEPVLYRYMLPSGSLRALRLDPIDREGRMTLGKARIVDSDRRVLHAFAPDDFKPVQHISVLEPEGDALRLETTPAAGDPILEVSLPAPVDLRVRTGDVVRSVAALLGTVFLGLVLAYAILHRFGREWIAATVSMARRRPVTAIAAASVLAVVVQCHPVVFLGRSFVSPDNGAYMLYGTFPTLPGYASAGLEDTKNSDVGAMLFQHLPLPRDEREALLQGEWPLWNRYQLSGTPLLGQGQSMFGELLNFIPLAAGSAAWAWDLKFLLARFVFAFSLGIVVWRLGGRLSAALLTAVAAVFIGFFGYRLNHPVNFSLCLAPLILLGWVLLREAGGGRRWLPALGLLFAGNWEVFHSGTVKEAYMAVACMNFAGLCLLACGGSGRRETLRRLGAAAVVGLLFVLCTAPWWMTFLDTLRVSGTSSDVPGAVQLPLSRYMGLFEDLFHRQFTPAEIHGWPSANLLVLAGIAWLVASAGGPFRRASLGIALGAVLPFSLAFKVVPASWIMATPFVGRIVYVDNTFCTALVVLLLVLGGLGFAACAAAIDERRWSRHWLAAAVFAGLALGGYFATAQPPALSPFFRGHLVTLGGGLAALWAAALHWRRRRDSAFLAVALLGGITALCWRHGQFRRTDFDDYVFNPRIRADLLAPSPAVGLLRSLSPEPHRPTGVGYTLYTGYNQMLGLESIFGVDALRNPHYDDLVVAAGLAKARWWGSVDYAADDLPRLNPLYDLLNVRYVLETPGAAPRAYGQLRKIASLDLELFENPTAWPRAFFTDRIASYASLAEFVDFMKEAGGRPFAALDGSEPAASGLAIAPARAPGAGVSVPARDYRLTANTTRFTVEAPGPGVIVLTEAYLAGMFRLEVNGRPTPHFRANHAFKGFAVPAAGRYEVTYEFRPPRFTLSLWIAGAGVLGSCGGTWFLLRRKRDNPLPAEKVRPDPSGRA